MATTVRDFLERCRRSQEEVDDFQGKHLAEGEVDTKRGGWTYSAELGWVLRDSVRTDGIHGSKTYYRYEETGARKRAHFPDDVARIHTYGNSFTHCDQVSDGETWQEYLASHFQEPIENYGVGGYSVYQAFRRMKMVEAVHPAEYVILNVWDDDNYRNLDSWRAIRFGGRKTSCGFTLPYIRVDLESDTVTEHDNLCPSPETLNGLTDLDWLEENFGDDPVLHAAMASGADADSEVDVPVAFGIPFGEGAEADEVKDVHRRAALRATRHVLEQAEAFCDAEGKKLMVVFSYGSGNIRDGLLEWDRWDAELVDFAKGRGYPVVDLQEWHAEDFGNFSCEVDEYLARYYNGHYAPAGNFLFAQAMRQPLIDWLKPEPLPYLET